MADEAEQSAPAEAAPAAEEPVKESASSESVAADQVREASASVPDSVPEVATETIEPVSQSSSTTGSEPARTLEQITTPAPQSSSSLLSASDLAKRGLAARRERREVKFQKILKLVREQGSIGSRDVQNHLHVCDSTATDYLNALVIQGKLKRVGPSQRARYELAG